MDHHDHHQHTNKKVLMIAFVLTFSFALLEVVSGALFHTLALLSEGIHMLSDGVSLFLSLMAVTIGMRVANAVYPFGYRRIETIAAFVNGLALLLVPLWVVYQAVDRFLHPRDIESLGMLYIAVIGLIINLVVAVVLSRGDKEHNLNLQSASLHVLADLLSSVATIITALVIHYWQFTLIDPLVSVMVSVVIFSGGIKITRDAFFILMERSPDASKDEALRLEVSRVPGVTKVLDYKSWSITSKKEQLLLSVEVDAYSEETRESLHALAREHGYEATIEQVQKKKNQIP